MLEGWSFWVMTGTGDFGRGSKLIEFPNFFGNTDLKKSSHFDGADDG